MTIHNNNNASFRYNHSPFFCSTMSSKIRLPALHPCTNPIIKLTILYLMHGCARFIHHHAQPTYDG